MSWCCIFLSPSFDIIENIMLLCLHWIIEVKKINFVLLNIAIESLILPPQIFLLFTMLYQFDDCGSILYYQFQELPSRIILYCITSIFCSKRILSLNILPKTCLFHYFILTFKVFKLSWKTFILDAIVMCNSFHHLCRRSTKRGS